MTPNSDEPRPDKMITAMRHIQEKFGYLPEAQMRDLSKDQGIPMYKIQAVASFFPHFRLTPPHRVTIKVCNSIPCHLAGSGEIVRELSARPDQRVRVQQVSCLGRCDRPPVACISVVYGSVQSDQDMEKERDFYFMGCSRKEIARAADDLLEKKEPSLKESRDTDLPYPAADWMIDPYRDDPCKRYEALRNLVAARDSQPGLVDEDGTPIWVADVMNTFNVANLRGMGGGGFPAARKWLDVHKAVEKVKSLARQRGTDYEAFVVVNGDESEPATFKDRELLLRYPHLIVEAVIAAGLVTGATEGFIYIRHEYPEQIKAVRAEILRAEVLGVCGRGSKLLGRSFPVSVFASPGGYICGEQTALIEAMSAHRGEPRLGPPRLATNGFLDKPTLLSNVETYAWVPYILKNSGEHYAKQGINSWKGRRFFSVCGDVNRPGVYEVPMGLTMREMIYGDQYCRGIKGNRLLKALAPSGPSAGFIPATWTTNIEMPAWKELASRRGIDPAADRMDLLDMELELDLFRALSPTHALGAGLIVFAEGRDMVEPAVNALEFFRNESCGKCVPCRVGSKKMANLGINLRDGRIEAGRWNILSQRSGVIDELEQVLGLMSICWLGRSVPVPLRTLIDYFPDDIQHRLK
jgi:formate dehydrogenase beta subunit